MSLLRSYFYFIISLRDKLIYFIADPVCIPTVEIALVLKAEIKAISASGTCK
jgi:hypothetical protein